MIFYGCTHVISTLPLSGGFIQYSVLGVCVIGLCMKNHYSKPVATTANVSRPVPYWADNSRIIVVMGHSHYGPVIMVHMVVVMVHLGKSLWSIWKSHYGPPKKGSGSSPNQVCLGVLSVIPAIF